MRAAVSLAVVSVVVAFPALAGNSYLAEARRLVEELSFEQAAKVLDAAERVEGTTRDEWLEILALEGVVSGTLGHGARAYEAFRELLLLDPGFELPADQPPRVRTPFFEAKEWVRGKGPFTAKPETQVRNGQVVSLAVTIPEDGLKLARTVRFHFRVDGATERAADVSVEAGRAEVSVGGATVDWWYEVLGRRAQVLLQDGSAASPLRERAGAPAPQPTPVPVADVSSSQAPAGKPESGGWMRPTGWGLLGAGVAAGGAGVAFGLLANGARSKVLDAEKNADGLVTGISRREALSLEQQAHTNAIVANILFGVGGALAASGVVLMLLGADGATRDGATVALLPGPASLTLSGAF